MASGHGPQFPSNISNALITNSTITNVNGNAYFNSSEPHELGLLRSKISVAALHNSGERYDAPRCHPGTRVAIQDDIMKWLDDVDDPELVLWMYGSAGVGKSAIAQAIATPCYESEPRRLAGAFFLSRTAPAESGRGDEKCLVATLAYQMAMNIPNLELYIANAIAMNRVVFELDLETQIRELILNPLAILSDNMSVPIPPMIFILDALDECSPTASQARIIKAFITIIGEIPHNFTCKLLVASRPESNIKSIFAAPEISPIVRSVSLDDNYKAQEDIRKFLVDGFHRFKETHPSTSIFPMIWPTDKDINELVRKSSGQFIYASTVQKYIQEEHANPILRLQSILDLTKDPINRPFAELDALYSHIFRQLKDLETVLYIMCIAQCCRKWYITVTVTFCESLLRLPKGGGTLALQGLSSVLKVDDDELEAYHASLADFLKDKHRSGDFCIYTNERCIQLCCLALRHILPSLSDNDPNSSVKQFHCSLEIFTKCTEYIEGPHAEIHTILATFDLEMIFQFLRNTELDHDNPIIFLIIYSYQKLFSWLLKEHQVLIKSNNMTLLLPISQLQKWTMGQLNIFQFDESVSSHSMDYLKKIFFFQDTEMYLLVRGLAIDTWVTGSAPQALTEDRIVQLMSQYCYYMRNSSWLNLIRNARLNIFVNGEQLGLDELCIWNGFFSEHAPPTIDLYLDIQYILGLNSSIGTAASRLDAALKPHIRIMSWIKYLHEYLLKVEEIFSCLTSPLNELEESTSTAAEQAMDREASLPYTPHPSDSASFALALAFPTIQHIEYRVDELVLPVA